jgi:hypothetical protein
MSSYCNSIFFCCKDINIDELQPYMLTVQNKEDEVCNDKKDSESNILEEKNSIQEVKPIIIAKEDTFIEPEVNQIEQSISAPEIALPKQTEARFTTVQPKQTDTLFWCIYIAVFGYNDYMEISRNYGVKELDIKKQIADFLQRSPSIFKNSNVKVTKVAIQEILSELLTSQKETSIMCLLAMIVKYHIHLLLVDPTDRFYLEYYHDKDMSESPTFIIQKDTFGKYNLRVEPLHVDELIQWKERRLALESFVKPLRAISLYKVSELEELARRFDIFDENKKYKKADLYNDISEVLRWR